jgi:large subunit ribosomal protein L19
MKANKYTKETILNIGVTDRNFPNFKAGDTVCITLKILEGEKERLQDFQGTVIAMRGIGITKSFTVRKITDGISIERIFPYYSPIINSISVINKGITRRAKLYYLRDKFGKSSEVKKEQKSSIKKQESTLVL